MKLRDKVILVTGSTTGIGEAIARRCVKEGARVLVHGLERDLGERVVAELGDVAALHIDDLSDPQSPQRLIDAALESFGKLDALVNNAALVIPSNIETTTADHFDRVMAVNVRAPMLLIQAALPHLAETRGCVLNVGSINGWTGQSFLLAYSVSKGALMALTRNLGDALFGAHGVRVNQINPAWVLTENEHRHQVERGEPPDWHRHLPKSYVPAGKLMSPEEVAEAACYWLGDAAGPISGSVMEMGQQAVFGHIPM